MIELTRAAEGSYRLGFGGDTFNTAIYLGRGGTEISYATALGDDPYSDGVHSLASAEGLGRQPMIRVPGRLPGVYLVETDPHGGAEFL